MNLIEEDVIGFVVESDASLNWRRVELGDLVAEVVQTDAEQDLVVEEFMLLTKYRPNEVIQKHIGVFKVFCQVPADHGIVGEEIESDLGSFRLQGLRHVSQTRADLNLQKERNYLLA